MLSMESERIELVVPHDGDRGSQYTPIRRSEHPAEAAIVSSVINRGDGNGNTLAETINGLNKADLDHRRGPWRTREAVGLATLG